MLFMSTWDIIASLAMALATLPMPVDVHDIYPFTGMAMGSTATCTFQGISILVGGMYTVLSNCTLNVYYVCSITHGMTEDAINRRVLPVMLGISTLYVCIFSFLGLSHDYFNPRPYEPFCIVGPYPHNCLEDDNDVECIRGGNLPHSLENFFKFTCLISGLLFLIFIMSSMTVVVLTVFKTELAWRQNRTSDFNNTRTALRQALMYIAAFVLTWIWLGIALISPGKPFNDYLKMFFQPLQGFFNAAIFFASKMHILRKSKPNLTRWQALKQMLMSPWTVPLMVVSQIDILEEYPHDDDDLANLEEVDWNERIKRTGRLRSDMPPLSVVSSNNTPSLDLSRAMSTKDILNVLNVEANEKAKRNASPDQVHNFEANADFEDKHHDGAVAEESDPSTNKSKEPREDRHKRTFYQWPPPTPSSSCRSNGSIWGSIFLGTSRRGCTSSSGAGTVSQHSRNQEDDGDEEEQVTSERNLSGFSCEQSHGDRSSVHSLERNVANHVESSSVSQAVNFGSSFIRSSMNLSDMIEDVSIEDDSDSNSHTTGGISYATP